MQAGSIARTVLPVTSGIVRDDPDRESGRPGVIWSFADRRRLRPGSFTNAINRVLDNAGADSPVMDPRRMEPVDCGWQMIDGLMMTGYHPRNERPGTFPCSKYDMTVMKVAGAAPSAFATTELRRKPIETEQAFTASDTVAV